MRHTRVFSNFGIAPFTGIRGSVNSIFRKENTGVEIAPLLQYLFEELQSLGYPTVRREIFSLVNVTNPRSAYSVGFQDPPKDELFLPYTGLAFTFSMSHRHKADQPKNITTVGSTDYSIFWGKSMLNTTDHVTICIPANIINRWELDYALTNDLIYLYNIVGIVTKAFVLNSSWLQRDGYTHTSVKNRDVLAAQYNFNLKRTIETRSFNNWVHSKEVWLRASNLIHEHHFYEEFGNYFAIELFDWVKTADLRYDAREYVYGNKPNGFVKYIDKGLRDLKLFMRNVDIHTPHMEAAIALLSILAGDDMPIFDPSHWQGLRQFESMPVVLGDTALAARELVNQTDFMLQIAEVL